MKRLLLTISLFFVLIAPNKLFSQNFEDGLSLYQQELYNEAVEIFITLDDERSILYTGKSYFSLGNYLKSNVYLDLLLDSSIASIKHEAWYTSALSHLRLGNYSLSLQRLYNLKESDNRTGLRIDSQRIYTQILNFLTESERLKSFHEISNQQIRYDLIRTANKLVSYASMNAMINAYENTILSADSQDINNIFDLIGTEEDYYKLPFRYPEAPQGMAYHIGVALPAFEPGHPQFHVSRNLFFGMLLAAEEFNVRNPDKKVFLRFRDTQNLSVSEIMADFAWNSPVQAIIGPLFSESAKEMAQQAELYQIPMIAPLANADSINLNYNYTYQINPTFEMHGRNMARFAVNELGLDTLAIITDRNSLGSGSASAFRYEAEQLGAHIAYYISDDFPARGFDISEYTQVFTPDSLLIDSLGYTPVQGIYAPFTGQASGTLISLLLNDLEALRSDVVILGSEEWANTTFTPWQNRNFEIYSTEAFGIAADSTSIEYFNQDFLTRFGLNPDQFARIGYDAGTYLMRSLEKAGNPYYLRQLLKYEPVYNGLSFRIKFDGRHINQHVNIRALSPKSVDRRNELMLD
jgi:ABC-type branched-subunit amino acid transport system substrate-binding protein